MVNYAPSMWVPSPNHWSGRSGYAITGLVLHGTAGGGAVGWFSNPASQVSAHYVVDVDGSVTQCVCEEDSAWHAGVVTPDSVFAGQPNPNLTTLGIEHVRDVTNTSPLTDAQLKASLTLVSDIFQRRGKLRIITHDQIDVGRVCPGPGFPADAFRALSAGDPDEAAAEAYYSQLGYRVDHAHALWAVVLEPLYRFWAKLAAVKHPLADLVKPGPLRSAEYATIWGQGRPAGAARLTNRTVGAYLGEDEVWHAYQIEI